MYENILVPVDGSEHALNAVKTAASLSKGRTDTTITVLYVQIDISKVASYLPGQDVFERLEKQSKEIIESAVQILKESGIYYETSIKTGDAAKEICDVAKHGGYDLIVMGSRGLGAFAQLALGSVSHKVIQHTELPVLIVK